MVVLVSCRRSGSYLHRLTAQDHATVNDVEMDVLSLKQQLTVKAGASVIGEFHDGTPAMVRGAVGKGTIYCAGFLPALDYIRKAELARVTKEEVNATSEPQSAHPAPPVIRTPDDIVALEPKNRLERSRNPWEFPTAVRNVLLTPVRSADVRPALTCSIPLVDAVPLHAEQGIVIPLSNYTLEALANVEFSLKIDRAVDRIESVHRGRLDFQEASGHQIRFTLPLEASDYVKIYYR